MRSAVKATTPQPTPRAWPWQLRQRSDKLELLDAPEISREALFQNLRELEKINTLLGGYGPTLQALERLLTAPTNPQGEPWRILDVGCGGGDTLVQIHCWARRQGIQVCLTGLDLQADCIAYARQYYGHLPIEWIQADYRELQPETHPVDVVTCALFCHHLSAAQLQHFLRWLPTVARHGFVINDLHRHGLAYYAIDLISRWPGCSRLFRNDARLSVWRGARRREWLQALAQAELQAHLHWAWAFRWLVWGRV